MRHLLLAVVVGLTLVACSNRDSEIADRRAVVDEAFESIVWPDGYEQQPEIVRADPNLDGLNTQPGRILTTFSIGDQDVSQIRDEFHESLVAAGFSVQNGSHECETDRLDVSFYNSDARIGSTTVSYKPEISPNVRVNFAWTVLTDETTGAFESRVPGQLPGCPGE